MKKMPMIFMPILVDTCSSASAGAQLNTGSSSECLEGKATKLVLAKSTFKFATLADFKLASYWATNIVNKNLVPLFSVYEVADANTESTKYESGSFSYVTEEEVKKMTCESYLDLCSHKALKSYQSSDYTQVFEITDKGEVCGVYASDGIQIKGQDLSEFDVSIRSRPTAEKPAYSMQTLTYRDFNEFEDNGVIVKEAWDITVLNGVFSLRLEIQGTPSATEIQVKAFSGCGDATFAGLVQANWALADGQTVTGSTYDSTTEIYTLTGVGLVSGTLGTDGVVTIDDWHYQAVDVTVTI